MERNVHNVKFDKTSKMWRTAAEVEEPETVDVEGTLPDWLNGNFYRIGPGKFDFENDYSLIHWQDGYSLISKFGIDGRNGKVSFQSKYLDSDAYRRAVTAQRPTVPEFATPAFPEKSKGFFSKLMSHIIPEATDNANHAFFTLGSTGSQNSSSNPVFITNGSGVAHELNCTSLKRAAFLDPNKIFGLTVCTPHPLTDPVTSISYNIGSSVEMTGLKYNLLQIPPLIPGKESEMRDQFKKSKIICTIPTQWTSSLSFNHSLGMTKNFIIFIEQPLAVNVTKLLTSTIRGKEEAYRDWLEWKTDAQNRFYIIEKSTGQLLNKNIKIISPEIFFFFHFINCFETTENELVMDLSTYENPDFLLGKCQVLSHVRRVGTTPQSNGQEHQPSGLSQRFVFPLHVLGIEISDEGLKHNGHGPVPVPFTLIPRPIIPEPGLELPTINKHFAGRAYRYFYASGLMTQGYFQNSVSKVDVHWHQVRRIKMSDRFIFGEPVFVSSGAEKEEDDGVLIVPMTDQGMTEPDMLFFFNAKDMTEIGRAVFRNLIPPSIHGIFIPN